MSNQQRIQTVKVVWDGDEAASKVVHFTTSVKGADKAVEDFNKILGKNAKVTSDVVLSVKEKARANKRAETQALRTLRNYERLTNELKREASMVNKTTEQQQKLNAIHRLGANATLSQKKEVVRLVDAMQKQNAISAQTQKSFRGLRGQAQNLGWQMQDVAVQMQMGTDTMVILSQQGSQLASGFGHGGAVVGALIAVGGAIAGVALKSYEASQGVGDLKKVTEELNKVFREATDGSDVLSERILKLAKRSESLAKIEVSKGIFDAQKQVKSAIKETMEIIEDIDVGRIGEGFRAAQIQTGKSVDEILKSNKRLGDLGGTYFRRLESDVDQLQDKYKLTREQAVELGISVERAFTDKSVLSIKTLQNTLEDLNDKTGGTNKKVVNLASKLVPLFESIRSGTDRTNLLRMAFTDLGTAIKKSEESVIKKKNGKSDIVKAFESEYDSLIKQTENTKQEYKRRKDTINAYVLKVGDIDLKAADAYEKLEKWKTDVLKKEEDARKKARDAKLWQVEKQIFKGGSSDPVADAEFKHIQIMKALSAEKVKLKKNEVEALKRIKDLEAKEEENYKTAKIKAEIEVMQTRMQLAGQASAMMTNTVDLLTNGVEQIRNQTAEMNGAQKAMFLFSQSIAAAGALINGISLGMKLAEMFPTAAPAMITTGTTLGAAQAGAIMGTTLAGTFDQGGVIPAGQKGIVAEYGDELVGGTMVYNNSNSGVNVTGRKDTAALMGGGLNVTVVNNAVGTVRAQVKQLDEGNVQVMIAEHFNNNIDGGVAASLSKRGSKSSKALTSNYKTSKVY